VLEPFDSVRLALLPFAAEGVTEVFDMMGDGNMYWMEALHDLGVNLLQVRHEELRIRATW